MDEFGTIEATRQVHAALTHRLRTTMHACALGFRIGAGSVSTAICLYRDTELLSAIDCSCPKSLYRMMWSALRSELRTPTNGGLR